MPPRPGQRTEILDATLRLAIRRDGSPITLRSVAHEAGISTTGLRYHFESRDVLLHAVITHLAERWHAQLVDALGKDVDEASPAERIGAFVSVAGRGGLGRAEFMIYADPSCYELLRAVWTQLLGRWFVLPDELSPAERSDLTLARLAAEGLWLTDATGVLAVPAGRDREAVLDRMSELVMMAEVRGRIRAPASTARPTPTPS